jgi:hypothetical protein
MSTQVDKHGLDIFKLEKSCIYPAGPNPKKDPGLPFSFSCVLNLLKSWSNLGFDQDSNGHKNSNPINIHLFLYS